MSPGIIALLACLGVASAGQAGPTETKPSVLFVDGVHAQYVAREANMDAFARRSAATKPGKKEVPLFAEWTSEEFFTKCNSLLDRAAREAGNDETIRQRVAFLRKAVELGELRHRYWVARAAAASGDRDAAAPARQIEQERMKWYQKLGISWAINAANLAYYGRSL